jgi:FdhE protein
VTIPGDKASVALERRAIRADHLAGVSAVASSQLRFAGGLYRAQSRVAEGLERGGNLQGVLEADAPSFIPLAGIVVSYIAEAAPDPLGQEARKRVGEDDATLLERLLVFWRGTSPHYLCRASLRPYVEVLASLRRAPDRLHREGFCPFCGGAPWIGMRREEPDSEATRRFFGCALCGGEWRWSRVGCPTCGETSPEKLPSFANDKYPTARIEACETCRRYVKTIDLTADPLQVPEVDDLLSLSLDLWAVDQEFERIEAGTAGL